MPRFPLPCKLASRRGLRLYLFVATIIGSFGLWPAIALRLSELSPSEVVALRFPDLSPAQIVALRFPEVSAFGASAVSGSPLLADLIDFQVAPTLPPVGHSGFCLRYPDDCKFRAIDPRHPNMALTPERGNELNVNRNVNRSIFAELTPSNGTTAQSTTTATASGSPSPLEHLIDFRSPRHCLQSSILGFV